MKILQWVSFNAACHRAVRLLLALLLLCGSLPASAQSLADGYLELAWGYAALGNEAAASRYRDMYLRIAYDAELAEDTLGYGSVMQRLLWLRQLLERENYRSMAETYYRLKNEAGQRESMLRRQKSNLAHWVDPRLDFALNMWGASQAEETIARSASIARKLNGEAEALKSEALKLEDELPPWLGQVLFLPEEQSATLMRAVEELAEQTARLAEEAGLLHQVARQQVARLIEAETNKFTEAAAAMREEARQLRWEAALLQGKADSLNSAAEALFKKDLAEIADLLRADAGQLRNKAEQQKGQAAQLDWQAEQQDSLLARRIEAVKNPSMPAGVGSSTASRYDGYRNCPSTFPWPPPRASASYELPQHLFQATRNLGDIENRLLRALDQCGYFERSFYCVAPPGESIGFALAARMEQIDREAYSLSPPYRWSLDIKPLSSFSLREIMQALFFKKPGYFRIVVFIVYDRPFRQTPRPLEQQAALELVAEGSNKLSADIRQVPFSLSYSCTALIYEFEAPESGKAPVLVTSRHDGKTHLERAKLLGALEKRK